MGSERSVRLASVRSLLSALFSALLVVALADPVGAYPSPPPDDFWHRSGAGHKTIYLPQQVDPYLSPRWSTDPARPLLVIEVTFGDQSAFKGWQWVQQRVFGQAPGVVGYFDAWSGGQFRFVPANESWGRRDGVVSVGMPTLGTNPTPNNVGTGYLGQGPDNKIMAAMRAADAYVQFDAFDASGDGRVSEDELEILVLAEDPGDSLGTTLPSLPRTFRLDGVTFDRAAAYASTYSPVTVWEQQGDASRTHGTMACAPKRWPIGAVTTAEYAVEWSG